MATIPRDPGCHDNLHLKSCTAVEVFVLDEADRLLDMDFIRDIKRATEDCRHVLRLLIGFASLR